MAPFSASQAAEITCEVIKQLFKNSEFTDHLASIVSTAVEKKLEEIVSNIETLQGDVLDLQSKLDKKDEQIKKLNREVDDHKTSINKLERDLDTMEQYSRRTCIRIFGIQEIRGENTDVLSADVITSKLEVPLDIRKDIDRSHRTGPAREPSTSSSSASKQERPRPIIVKLTSYRKRAEILANRKKLKGTGVTIAEDLTKKNLDLLKKTRKSPKVEAAWTSDGRVIALVPASNGTEIKRRIRSEEDLRML